MAAICAVLFPNIGAQLPDGVELLTQAPNTNIYEIATTILIAFLIIWLRRLWNDYKSRSDLKKFRSLQLVRFTKRKAPGDMLAHLENMLTNFQSVNDDVRKACGVLFYTEYLEQIRNIKSNVENARKSRGRIDANMLARDVEAGLRDLVGRV